MNDYYIVRPSQEAPRTAPVGYSAEENASRLAAIRSDVERAGHVTCGSCLDAFRFLFATLDARDADAALAQADREDMEERIITLKAARADRDATIARLTGALREWYEEFKDLAGDLDTTLRGIAAALGMPEFISGTEQPGYPHILDAIAALRASGASALPYDPETCDVIAAAQAVLDAYVNHINGGKGLPAAMATLAAAIRALPVGTTLRSRG